MNFKDLFADDRAVSPVIGVILMVAITVILAAVIGTFVLGLGSGLQQTSPQATFGFEVTDSKTVVTVTHETGDSIDSSQLNVSTAESFEVGPTNDTVEGSEPYTSASFKTLGITDGKVSAGDSVAIQSNTAFGGQTIRVVWFSAQGDNSATLSNFEVPS